MATLRQLDAAIPWLLVAVAREHLYFRPKILQTLRTRPTGAWHARLAGRDFILAETGVGGDAVRATLDWLRERTSCQRALFAGFAGALRTDLNVGDAIGADCVVSPSGERYSAMLPATFCTRRGTLVTSDRLVGSPDEKRHLAEQHDALAVDMESSYFAAWCVQRDVPWNCVRVISDRVGARVSKAAFDLIEDGRVPLGRLATTLLRHPLLIRELWELGRATRAAARTIAAVFAEWLEVGHRVTDRPTVTGK